MELSVSPHYEYRQAALWRGCAIFSTSVTKVSSAHCCLIRKPAATLKAIIQFASRIAHCHRRAEVASCKVTGLETPQRLPEWQVPRTTLRDRIEGRGQRKAAHTHRRCPQPIQEAHLTNWVLAQLAL